MSVDKIMMNRIWKQRDDLVKENLRLQERIKLLDEYIHNLQKLGDSMALGRNPFIQNAWLEAKEANP